MNSAYDASAIEVLSGLEPVRKRPGMYTDTSRPNHLAQEVIGRNHLLQIELVEQTALPTHGLAHHGLILPLDPHKQGITADRASQRTSSTASATSGLRSWIR